MSFYLLMVVVSTFAVDRLGQDSGMAGVAASTFIVGALLSRLFAGSMTALIGYKPSLIIGMAGVCAFSLSYILASDIWILLVIRLLHGLAFGITTTAAPAIVADVIPQGRNGEGMGYYALGPIISTGVGPFIAITLGAMGNYETIFIICFAFTLSSVILLPLLRLQRIELTPEQRAGFKRLHIDNMVEKAAVPMSSMAMMMFLCYGAIVSFIGLFTREIGLAAAASVFFVAYAATAFVSRPFIGKLFDAKGVRVIIYPALVIFAAGLVLFSQLFDLWMIIAAGIIIGIGAGAIQGATLPEAIRVTQPHRRAITTTTYYLFCDVGYSIGPLLVGFLIPVAGYRGMYLALAAVPLIALILYAGLQSSFVKNRQKPPLDL